MLSFLCALSWINLSTWAKAWADQFRGDAKMVDALPTAEILFFCPPHKRSVKKPAENVRDLS